MIGLFSLESIFFHFFFSSLVEKIYGSEMIGLSGLTFKYLGKDNSGIHLPSETSLASSGVNGF